jgi:hypothetical protein
MVLLAKEAAAAKRQDKLHPKGKRKRIQEANIQLSNNESSQPLQAEKTNLSRQVGSTDKPVTAGLARLNLLDDLHENARLTGKSEYCRMVVCYLDQDDFKGNSNSVLKLSCVYAYLFLASQRTQAALHPKFAEGTKLGILHLALTTQGY